MVELQAPNGQAHPILRVLHERGSTVSWLARRLEMNRTHTSLVVHGHRQATEAFRAACALALGRPESDLFHDDSATPLTDERRIA